MRQLFTNLPGSRDHYRRARPGISGSAVVGAGVVV